MSELNHETSRDLSRFTEEELCQIYDNLNSWRWDDRLGEKPNGWDNLPNFRSTRIGERLFNSKFKIITPIKHEIVCMVGNKKLHEWHWIHNLHKTKEEYEAWLFKEMADKFLEF